MSERVGPNQSQVTSVRKPNSRAATHDNSNRLRLEGQSAHK